MGTLIISRFHTHVPEGAKRLAIGKRMPSNTIHGGMPEHPSLKRFASGYV